MASGREVHMMARGWRGESVGGVWRQAMWGLVMGLSVAAVAGAPAAMQPSSSSSSENGAVGEVGCERPITDVVWGFGLTLLANFVAAWHSSQHMEKRNLPKLVGTLGFTFLGPIWILMISFGNTFQYVPMVCHLHKMRKEEMTIARIWAMLNPWSKSPTRFLAACDIIMYVQKEELLRQSRIWRKEIFVEDETEAMVVGEEPDEETMVVGEEIQYEKKQLSNYGKVALLWGEYFSSGEKLRILPKYGQLKVLRTNSGFAVIAIGIQAIGYTYAVIFRSVKGLRAAPVEVIGLVVNIMLLIGVIFYGTSNPCARPLVIYMNNEQEGKFVKALQLKQKEDFEVNLGFSRNFFFLGMIIVVVLCISILLYFIVTLRRATNMMIVLPLIIFVASLLFPQVFHFLAIFFEQDQFVVLRYVIISISVLSSIVAYVWALIVTFYYWKSQHFNTRPELIDLSQLIPFIG